MYTEIPKDKLSEIPSFDLDCWFDVAIEQIKDWKNFLNRIMKEIKKRKGQFIQN